MGRGIWLHCHVCLSVCPAVREPHFLLPFRAIDYEIPAPLADDSASAFLCVRG
ncbi:hypothetical protein ASPCADRAFT_203664 [Aspergillus carbonarius ITEM 5010]|uniref:Uncharacterized protein n=1 Tax=Aspergillus carbonarius (strain ITEM 5010) TaxID=602072 RepID=A0A1R3RZF7_ASPC5|nr:hypothetical protein ASPCADRAFT_203664 [Aspergillus carbonarius ITEM 5010]